MGSTGATLGIVGTDCIAAALVEAVLVVVGGVDVDVGGAVGKTISEVDVADTGAWGFGCRLCDRQFVSEGLREPSSNEPDRMSRAAGCVK